MSFSLESCTGGLRPPGFWCPESATTQMECFSIIITTGYYAMIGRKVSLIVINHGIDPDARPTPGAVGGCPPASAQAHGSRGCRAPSRCQCSLAREAARESEDRKGAGVLTHARKSKARKSITRLQG